MNVVKMVTLKMMAAAIALLASGLRAEDSGYQDPDASAHEALELVQCINPVDSAERAIYCARLHGGQNAVPQENTSHQASHNQTAWRVTQTDDTGAEWLYDISVDGELLRLQAPH